MNRCIWSPGWNEEIENDRHSEILLTKAVHIQMEAIIVIVYI